jgi:hypothetical protein
MFSFILRIFVILFSICSLSLIAIVMLVPINMFISGVKSLILYFLP